MKIMKFEQMGSGDVVASSPKKKKKKVMKEKIMKWSSEFMGEGCNCGKKKKKKKSIIDSV